MVRTLVSAAVVCAMVGLAGGCASHKGRQARGRDGKIPTDRSVLTGVATSSGKHGVGKTTPVQAFAPAPAPAPMPVAAVPAPAFAPLPAPSAPQFQPVDPTDFAAPRPAYASAYNPPAAAQRPLPPPLPAQLPAFAQPAAARFPKSPAAPLAAGGRYQVQKGDTLFGIARSRYGDGKRWQEIASANPGLTPATLRAGATILVP